MVLVAHSYTLSGNGVGFTFNGDHLGTWAVYGFFCLSGYLITASRIRTRFIEYLGHRIARIYPGFLVSLVVVAFGFAPVAYLHERGTLDGFLTAVPTPLNYLAANAGLNMREYVVAGTLAGNLHPGAWNGSLWSLYYEFLCYLVIGALLSFAFLRRRPVLLVPVFVVSVVAATQASVVASYFGGNGEVAQLLELLPFFLGGAVVFALKDRLPLTWWSAAGSLAGFVALVHLDGDWGPALSAPLLTLALLWLGAALPCPALLRRNDISYGCYIYAFPCQQLVTVLGGAAWGTGVHAALSVPGTVVLATASWLLVERRAMRAVRGQAERSASIAVQAAPSDARVAVPAGP